MEFISLQAHSPIDGAKEELKEDISNLKQEVMVDILPQYIVFGYLDMPSLQCFISIYSLHFTF